MEFDASSTVTTSIKKNIISAQARYKSLFVSKVNKMFGKPLTDSNGVEQIHNVCIFMFPLVYIFFALCFYC